jgi:hypothetical protein
MLFGFALGGAIGIFLLALTSPPKLEEDSPTYCLAC